MAWGSLTLRPVSRPALKTGGMFTPGADALRERRDANLEGVAAAGDTRPALPLERGPMRDRAKEAKDIAAMAGNSASEMNKIADRNDAYEKQVRDAAQKDEELSLRRDELDNYKLGLGYDKLNAQNQLGYDRLNNQAGIAGMNNGVKWRVAVMADGTKRWVVDTNNASDERQTGANIASRELISGNVIAGQDRRADAGNILETDQFNASQANRMGSSNANGTARYGKDYVPPTAAPAVTYQPMATGAAYGPGNRPQIPNPQGATGAVDENQQSDRPNTPSSPQSAQPVPQERPTLPLSSMFGPFASPFADAAKTGIDAVRQKLAPAQAKKPVEQPVDDTAAAQQEQLDAIRSDPEFKRQAEADASALRPEDVGLRSALPVAQPSPTPTLAIGGRDRGQPGDPGFDPLPSEIAADQKYQERMQQARIQAGLVPPSIPAKSPSQPSIVERPALPRANATTLASQQATLPTVSLPAIPQTETTAVERQPLPVSSTAGAWAGKTGQVPISKPGADATRAQGAYAGSMPLPRPGTEVADNVMQNWESGRESIGERPSLPVAGSQPDHSAYPYVADDPNSPDRVSDRAYAKTQQQALSGDTMEKINSDAKWILPGKNDFFGFITQDKPIADLRAEMTPYPIVESVKQAAKPIAEAGGNVLSAIGDTGKDIYHDAGKALGYTGEKIGNAVDYYGDAIANKLFGYQPDQRTPERVALDNRQQIQDAINKIATPEKLAAWGINPGELESRLPQPEMRLAYLQRLQQRFGA